VNGRFADLHGDRAAHPNNRHRLGRESCQIARVRAVIREIRSDLKALTDEITVVGPFQIDPLPKSRAHEELISRQLQ